MIVIGSFFVFIMYFMGTILTVDCNITVEEEYQFYDDVLNLHNEYRKNHGQKPLKWDDDLSQLAEKAVYEILYEKIVIPSEIYGMNHYTGFVSIGYKLKTNEATMLMTQWYDKGKNYKYTEEPSSATADSFTQVVWQNTEKLGASMLTKSGVIGVVVFYYPRGNKIGEYMMNVKDPQKVEPLNK